MDKTIGYWIEKLIPLIIGVSITIVLFFNWEKACFLITESFFDKIVGITSTLFGFLLAILALLIQSDSETVSLMKTHKSFSRLISLNKTTVISSMVNCFLAFITSSSKEYLEEHFIFILKILESSTFGLFCFVLTSSFIFTLIFYKIILNDA
ncbi:hypothetical protein [Flagellimonas baculiformis]|uniref:hypothetical protein n=1 Tax=Flagellimonas baculiformis TaxID=3067310 RepID=UPI00296E4F4E|nr:hypothetical protein [Muricauda sp. D6]